MVINNTVIDFTYIAMQMHTNAGFFIQSRLMIASFLGSCVEAENLGTRPGSV